MAEARPIQVWHTGDFQMISEHDLQNRLREVQLVYGEARKRSGAPWQLLDCRASAITNAVARVINADWMCKPVSEKTAEYERIQESLTQAEADFIHWRDMPAQELASASVKSETRPASPAQPAERARFLLDSLHQRGIRLEVGSKGRISARPARLLTDQDKAGLTTLKAHVVALWKERNDVWVVE